MTTDRPSSPDKRARRQDAGLLRARLTLFTERLWPALLPSLGIMALFVLVTLFDLWRFMPWIAHYGVLGTMVALFVYFLIRDLRNLEWPTRAEAMARLEADGKVPHAALRSREDKPFRQTDSDSPLWRAHLDRMDRLASGARLGKAHATADRRDPYALRYGAALALVVGLFVAWGDLVPRFWNALSPRPVHSIPATVDLWVDPPAYTGRPPVILVQSANAPEGSQQGFAVPEGSILHARIAGADRRGPGRARLDIDTTDGRERPDLSQSETSLIGEVALTENAAITLTVNGRRASWPVVVAADEAPSIHFRERPSATEEGRVRMVVEIEDDYGITGVNAVLSLDPDQERPLDTPAITPERAAEEQVIPVGDITGAYGVRSSEIDLTDHPWAGLAVELRLVARDGAGQEAETPTQFLTLPEREFYNPLAQAIIHERRNLAVAPESWTETSRSLDALTFAPDRFFDRPKEYLMLRAAYWSVMKGRGENTDDVVEEFWPLALQLEDQELELARRALQAAREALREALERGAPQNEIEDLVENLRMAMQNYIQALAESGQSMAQGGENSQELGSRDLDDMLDSITDLSDSGANNAARQMLSELEQMLDNLRIAQGSGSGTNRQDGESSGQSGEGDDQRGGPGGEAAQTTGDMIARQRELTDDTYDAQRQRNGIPGEPQGGASPEELRQRQLGLSEELQTFMENLEEGSMGQGAEGGEQGSGQGTSAGQDGEQTRRAFGQARQRMQDAARALENGNLSAANRFQEEALESLREGADGISEQMMQAGETGEEGETGQQAGNRSGGQPAQVDPLGRPYGAPAPSGDIGIPDLSNPEQARELIMELRRKLSEPGRTDEEIEYLERLLERF